VFDQTNSEKEIAPARAELQPSHPVTQALNHNEALREIHLFIGIDRRDILCAEMYPHVPHTAGRAESQVATVAAQAQSSRQPYLAETAPQAPTRRTDNRSAVT